MRRRHPRYPNVSCWRNDQDRLYIYLYPNDVSLVHVGWRIRVKKTENPDLAKTCALWVFTSLPSLTREVGVSFSTAKGVYQLERAGSTCFSATFHWGGPSTLPPGTSPKAAGAELGKEQSRKEPLRKALPPCIPALDKASQGTSGEPFSEEVIQKPRWPGGPP